MEGTLRAPQDEGVKEKMGKVKLDHRVDVESSRPVEKPEVALERALAEVREDRRDSYEELLHPA